MRAAGFALLVLGFAAIPAAGQVNLARWGKAKICPTWGCGPEHVKSGAIQSATAQTGNSPGADLHLEFPIFNRAVPNRAQLQATLVYDSLFWGPVSGQGHPAACIADGGDD
ncbi:MAG TPA: hypothetical protein VN690_13515 [Terriglobales bacterium]|nr:hypothetical protein [Terriglobales bacterium]